MVTIDQFYEVLHSESLFERFAARKFNGVRNIRNDFIQIKNEQGQMEHDDSDEEDREPKNKNVGFKCSSYSVTENYGKVSVTVIKH